MKKQNKKVSDWELFKIVAESKEKNFESTIRNEELSLELKGAKRKENVLFVGIILLIFIIYVLLIYYEMDSIVLNSEESSTLCNRLLNDTTKTYEASMSDGIFVCTEVPSLCDENACFEVNRGDR